MAHFAQLNENNVVERVIVATQEFINSGAVGEPSSWVQTSYNAHKGVGLRKNFAGEGYTYDKTRDAFIPPQPYPSWVLNETTCDWDAPKPMPEGTYYWDENILDWVQVTRKLIN